MITIKTSLFAPTFFLIFCVPLVLRDSAGQGARRAMTTVVLAAAVGFAAMYTAHARDVKHAIAPSSTLAASALSKTIAQAGIFPRIEILSLTLKWDLAFWAFWFVGLGVLVRRIKATRGFERARWLEVAALALPVALAWRSTGTASHTSTRSSLRQPRFS